MKKQNKTYKVDIACDNCGYLLQDTHIEAGILANQWKMDNLCPNCECIMYVPIEAIFVEGRE